MQKYFLALILATLSLTGCQFNNDSQQKPIRDDDWIVREMKELGPDFNDCSVFSAKADSALAAERNAKNYCWKGRALGLEGKHKESVAYLDSALSLAGDDAVLLSYYHSCKAFALLMLGETDKERAEYQAIIDIGLEGYVDEAKEDLVRSYYHEGKYKEALDAVPDALTLEGLQYYRLIINDLGILDEESDYVKLEHIWKPINKARFMLAAPSNGEVSSWERGFENVNKIDSVSREELKAYGNIRRFMAVKDFANAWYGQYRSLSINNLRETEWRLLQYDTTAVIFENLQDKVAHLKEVYEDVLTFDAKTEDELTLRSTLAKDFERFYKHIQQ
ncbi:MAG: hypothetical protein J6S97_09975 [Bacteroidales bacterium]|nr:hypothetical protein [Bacteroidales bacterium]